MMNERSAIVTGGTGALGRCIVRRLASENFKVYVPAISIDDFNSVFDESQSDEGEFRLKKIYSFVCNAEDESSVREFVTNVAGQEKKKIDVLINTVGGIIPGKDVTDLDPEDIRKMLNLNFWSTFYFTHEVLKYMPENNYGRIISIGAMPALEVTPGRFAYSFSKMGVIRLMDTVSEEMKSRNIRCNTIIPSIIDTPSNREWGSKDDIKKWVKPEDIAEIIFDLLQDKISPVRSSHIKVYGSV
jgi:NAD(P)-dependent dehydrogenase (short-subunit alcohol dehydrogenase family)